MPEEIVFRLQHIYFAIKKIDIKEQRDKAMLTKKKGVILSVRDIKVIFSFTNYYGAVFIGKGQGT